MYTYENMKRMMTQTSNVYENNSSSSESHEAFRRDCGGVYRGDCGGVFRGDCDGVLRGDCGGVLSHPEYLSLESLSYLTNSRAVRSPFCDMHWL